MLAVPSFGRLSAVMRSLFIQRYLQIKTKIPKLKWRSQSRLVKLKVCCSFWGYHKPSKAGAGTYHCSLLHHRSTCMASAWRWGSHRYYINSVQLRFQLYSENKSQAPQGSSNWINSLWQVTSSLSIFRVSRFICPFPPKSDIWLDIKI